jgi:hypothetical protein
LIYVDSYTDMVKTVLPLNLLFELKLAAPIHLEGSVKARDYLLWPLLVIKLQQFGLQGSTEMGQFEIIKPRVRNCCKLFMFTILTLSYGVHDEADYISMKILWFNLSFFFKMTT